jgi:hypothetical protein
LSICANVPKETGAIVKRMAKEFFTLRIFKVKRRQEGVSR